MPLPWKRSKSGRISRFVSDFQQSPKHGGSLVVETGFPTSLIDLFVKNRDRMKKPSPKRNNNNKNKLTAPPIPPKRRVLPPLSPSPIPQKLDPPSVTEEPKKIEESAENRSDGGGGNRGGCCVLMVVAFKVFVVAVLALSTKKLAVGITLSAFSLLFLEFAVARVFTLLNICPNATELDSLIGKFIGTTKKRRKEIVEEEEESTLTQERKNRVVFEIVEEWSEEVPQLEKKDSDVVVEEEKEVQTIRDVVFKKEKSKSSKLKSKIVKKIVPKKLRSYKKKRKMMKIKKGEEEEVEEDGSSTTEVSSLYSDERVESEVSERDEVNSNPPLLESCCEEIGDEGRGDLTKAIVLIVIVLAGLLSGKVLAIVLTLSWFLILRVFFCKSQTSL